MLKEYLLDYKLHQIAQQHPELNEGEISQIYRDTIISRIKRTRQGYVLPADFAEEIFTLAIEGKIELVMDSSDVVCGLDIDYNGKRTNPFEKTSDILLVHKTPIMPENDTILTRKSTQYQFPILFLDPTTQTSHELSYASGNDTIHYALNCPVSNHETGNDWDSCKYAVLVSLDKMDRSKILDIKSEDSYTEGDSHLGDHYFAFCPLGEREEFAKKNPGAIIIEYDGISLNQAINTFISYSGRKVKEFGPYGWGRQTEYDIPDPDEKYLAQLIERENLPHIPGKMHSETKYMARRMWRKEYNALIALLEYNHANNINMPDEVILPILVMNQVYSLPGFVPSTIELYKEYVVPILEEHGYKIGDDFFDGIQEKETIKYNSNRYDPTYNALIPDMHCPEWENQLRERAISLIKRELDRKRPDGSAPTVPDEIEMN